MEPDRLDVSSYLIDASIKNNTLEQDRHWLNGDSIAIIIAGRLVSPSTENTPPTTDNLPVTP